MPFQKKIHGAVIWFVREVPGINTPQYARNEHIHLVKIGGSGKMPNYFPDYDEDIGNRTKSFTIRHGYLARDQ